MKECIFCNKERKIEGGYTDIILDLPNETIAAVGEDILKIQVSYCPMCGRKLEQDVKED